jgi:hypothetical protein
MHIHKECAQHGGIGGIRMGFKQRLILLDQVLACCQKATEAVLGDVDQLIDDREPFPSISGYP